MNTVRHHLELDLRNFSRETARAISDLIRKDVIETGKLLKKAKKRNDRTDIFSLDRVSWQATDNVAQIELYLSGN